MADIDTNVTTAPVEQGKTDVGTEGVATQATTTEETPKTFSQADLDRIVQSRLAEKERTLKSKFEKDLEAKLAETRDAAQKDLDALVDERVNTRLAERELAAARTNLINEYGLDEDQASRLVGATADELQADAKKIYGAFKQDAPRPKPPVLKTGAAAGGPEHPLDISRMTPEEIRKNRNALWKTARVP